MAHNGATARVLPHRPMMRLVAFERAIDTVDRLRAASGVSSERAIDEDKSPVVPNRAAIPADAARQLDVLQGEARSRGDVEHSGQAGTANRHAALAGRF